MVHDDGVVDLFDLVLLSFDRVKKPSSDRCSSPSSSSFQLLISFFVTLRRPPWLWGIKRLGPKSVFFPS